MLGRLSRLIQGHICTAEMCGNNSNKGHDIPVLDSLRAPWSPRRCNKAPQPLPGTPDDVQETSDGAQKMKFWDATTSVAPSRFS